MVYHLAEEDVVIWRSEEQDAILQLITLTCKLKLRYCYQTQTVDRKVIKGHRVDYRTRSRSVDGIQNSILYARLELII